MSFKPIGECLACGSGELKAYLDLGLQPLANSYHDGTVTLPEFPLAVSLCERCWHSQLTAAVDPELMFKEYLYVSGTTSTLTDYFRDFVASVESKQGRKLSVLDIASNDGSLLEQFKLRDHTVQGVDPAANLAPVSAAKGIDTLVDYWSPQIAESLGPSFDVIVAMNVLAHVANPHEFLSACRSTLKPSGRVYIQTSQSRMIPNGEFDTIYHEHHSFFTVRSFSELAHRSGFKVLDAARVPVHGLSYLWTLGTDADCDSTALSAMIWQEQEEGLNGPAIYERFADRVHQTARETRTQLQELKDRGYSIVGYGAAAKANTFLNFAEIDLDYIVDDNPLKTGLLTPGRNIPIFPTRSLAETAQPLAVVILAWNFASEIMKRVAAQRPDAANDIFFQYFPEPRICQSQPY